MSLTQPNLDLHTPDNGRGNKEPGNSRSGVALRIIGKIAAAAAIVTSAFSPSASAQKGTPSIQLAELDPKLSKADIERGDIDVAKAHFKRGIIHYKGKKYQDALKEFQTAYDAVPPSNKKMRGVLSYNLAQTFLSSGDYEQAKFASKQALSELPGDDKDEDRREVFRILGEIEAHYTQHPDERPRVDIQVPPAKEPPIPTVPPSPVPATPVAPAPVPVTPIPVAPAPEPAKPPEPIPGGNKGEGKEGRPFEKSVSAALYAAVGRNIGNNGAVEGKGGVLGALRLRQQDSNNAGEVSLSYALGRSPVNARGDDGVVAEAATRTQAVQVGGAYVRELVRNGKLSLGVYVEGRGGLLWRSPAETKKGRDTLAGFGLTGELQTGIEGGYALDPIKGHVVVLRLRLGTALSATHQFSGGPENGSADFASVMQALSIGVDVE